MTSTSQVDKAEWAQLTRKQQTAAQDFCRRRIKDTMHKAVQKHPPNVFKGLIQQYKPRDLRPLGGGGAYGGSDGGPEDTPRRRRPAGDAGAAAAAARPSAPATASRRPTTPRGAASGPTLPRPQQRRR